MKKILSVLSLAAVMFVATAQVAHAFNADVIVDKIRCNPNDTVSVRLKFLNNEDRPLQFWGVEVKMLDIYNPDGKMIFMSGNFTVNVDGEGDFIVPAHGEKIWDFNMTRSESSATAHTAYAPNMDKVPNITYDWTAGWRLRWDYFPRVNYAE